jgi:uncharacterized OB-fold protein
MSGVAKPLPRPTPESQPFWDAVQERKLVLQHCRSCRQFWFPPSALCRHCLSTDFTWQESEGEGRIYSFVVYHRLYHPAFEADLPYVVALVELPEGPRLLTNIIGTTPDDIRCDLPVHVVFHDDGRGMLLPQFAISK